MFEIKKDDLSGLATRRLLELHLQGMHANSPAGSVFALDLSGLTSPDVMVWSVAIGDEIVAVGALKMLASGTAEVKSMRTHPDHVRKGAAAALLDHIITFARSHGIDRLSLETGSGDSFEPALRLYKSRGFTNGRPFGAYTQSAFNQFLHLDLASK